MMEFWIFLFGIVIGSFLNVVILRVPEKKSIAFPASHCPKCQTPLKWWHNIPLISWIILRGKCAYCQEKISLQYPAVELLSGLILLGVYVKNGMDIFSLALMLSFLSLLVAGVVDLRYKAITYVMNVLPVTFAFFASASIGSNVIHALLFAGGAVLLRDYVSALISKEAMGEGDILVFATMGAIVGIKLGVIAIFIAALYAIIPSLLNRVIKHDLELPFIPFLSLGLFTVWFFDSYFLKVWTQLYG